MEFDKAEVKRARTANASHCFSYLHQTEAANTPEVSLGLLPQQQGAGKIRECHDSNRKIELGFQAVATGDLETLRDMLHGFRAFSNLLNSENDIPLLIASRFGQYEVIKLLIESGADPSTLNESGENVLHYLWHFDRCEAADLLQLFVRQGADPFTEAKGRLHNPVSHVFPLVPGLPMERAAAIGRLDLVQLFMEEFPVYPRNGNVIRRTLLWAVRLHHTDIQDLLIAYALMSEEHSILYPLTSTLWSYNGQRRNIMEAACLGWISADGTGADLPFNFWMQCCHGAKWKAALENTLRALTYLDLEPRAMEERVDRSLNTAFSNWACNAFSILLDLKAEVTSGSFSRTLSLRPLAWKDVLLKSNADSWATIVKKRSREDYSEVDAWRDEYLPL